MISTLQISAMLDYGRNWFRRICKGIKINKSCWLYLCSGGHGDHSTRLYGHHKGFYNGHCKGHCQSLVNGH